MQNTLKPTTRSTRAPYREALRERAGGGRTLGTSLAMGFALMAASMGTVNAQTAYTLRELTPPAFPTTQNEWQAEALGDNGDVSGIASWVSGQGWAFDLSSLKFYRNFTYTFRMPVWRNSGDGASFLPLPFGGSVGWGSNHGVDGTGRVLGLVQSLFSPSFTWWTGTQRSTLSPSLGRFPINWFASRTNAAGKVAAYSNEPSPRVVILSGRSTVQDLPLPPEPGLTTGNAIFSQSGNMKVLINNQDQVALITSPAGSGTAAASTKVWFWHGTAWTDITPPKPAESLPRSERYIDFRLFDLNNAGQVLVGESANVFNTSTGAQEGRYFKWVVTPGVGMVELPQGVADGPGEMVLADNGDVAGWFPDTLNTGAALWRQGQVIDLNSLTPQRPAGVTIADVVDANAKGQLLVRLRGASNIEAIRFGVLTPR